MNSSFFSIKKENKIEFFAKVLKKKEILLIHHKKYILYFGKINKYLTSFKYFV